MSHNFFRLKFHFYKRSENTESKLYDFIPENLLLDKPLNFVKNTMINKPEIIHG